jgi:hypothetical protein
MAGINSALAKRIAQLCLTDGEEADVHFRVGGKTGKVFFQFFLRFIALKKAFKKGQKILDYLILF